MRFSLRAFALAAALSGLAGTAQATVTVIDPGKPVVGQSQLSLSQQWWQWALSSPAASNPVSDTTGAFAQENNNGKVFFLAGNFGGSSERNITVPQGKPLFFPIVNAFDMETPQLGDSCFDGPNPLQCALAFIKPGLDQPLDLHATLDGRDLLVFPSFRQTSTGFYDLTLSKDNLLGLPADKYPTVSDGYWVALKKLAPGAHTLVFGGTLKDFQLEVTDHLYVVPEPPALLVLLPALFALTAFRRRRQ